MSRRGGFVHDAERLRHGFGSCRSAGRSLLLRGSARSTSSMVLFLRSWTTHEQPESWPRGDSLPGIGSVSASSRMRVPQKPQRPEAMTICAEKVGIPFRQCGHLNSLRELRRTSQSKQRTETMTNAMKADHSRTFDRSNSRRGANQLPIKPKTPIPAMNANAQRFCVRWSLWLSSMNSARVTVNLTPSSHPSSSRFSTPAPVRAVSRTSPPSGSPAPAAIAR